MLPPTFLSHLAGFQISVVNCSPAQITLVVAATRATACCPLCGRRSTHRHSRYRRTVADLPWSGVPVTLLLRTRRFFCGNPACRRRVFAERFPVLVATYARQTLQRHAALERVGFALGGAAGARLARALGLATSASRLLTLVRRTPLAVPPPATVVGVDEWSFRRGHRFGTIICDLERHRVVDLLPERSAEAVATWLAAHPGVRLATRDRSELYADGLARGAPAATQLADRFHVLKNLVEALERHLHRKRAALALVEQGTAPVLATIPLTPVGQARRHTPWLARYEQIRELHARGADLADLARTVGVSRTTVYRWLRQVREHRMVAGGSVGRMNRVVPVG